MLLFISAILSFVWRTGSTSDPTDPVPLGPRLILALRILITAVFALGMIYLFMIIKTLKKYGSHQSSTKAILFAGLSTDARITVGSPKGAGNKVNASDDLQVPNFGDETAERRGRSREREVIGSARRKSGTHKRWNMKGSSRRATASKRSALSPLFGFGAGSSKPHSTDDFGDDIEVELDLKAPVEVVVKEPAT